MMLDITIYFLWFLLYSCLGWVYESIVVSIGERQLVNRGFLNGPICPIYGVGALLCILVLGGVHNPLVVFIYSAVGASVLEYSTSWSMERLFHARWWDYSNMRCNLKGRICLLGTLVFGLCGLLITYGIQPWVRVWTDMVPSVVILTLALVFALLLLIDLAVTLIGLASMEDALSRLSEIYQAYSTRADLTWQSGKDSISGKVRALSQYQQDVMSRMQNALSRTVNRQQRRILISFPKFRILTNKGASAKNYDKIIDLIRKLRRRR